MNEQINQSPNNQELKPKKNNNILLVLGFLLGALLIFGVGYYLGTKGIFDNNKNDTTKEEKNDKDVIQDDDEKVDTSKNNDEEEIDYSKNFAECGVSEKHIFDLIKELDSKVVLYKYFPDYYKPFDFNPQYYSLDSYIMEDIDGGGCIISAEYVYLKKENKVYFLTIGSDYSEYVDIDDYNSMSLWVYIKDHILSKDNYYKDNFYSKYCIFPTKYDYSDTYKIEIRECGSRVYYDNPGKLIATYTVDLNTKKYTVEDFR